MFYLPQDETEAEKGYVPGHNSRLRLKTLWCDQFEVALDERHFDHASEILGGLLES